MEQLFGQLSEQSDDLPVAVQSLATDELRAAGIDSVANNESYSLLEMNVLRRVMLRGVARQQTFATDQSLLVAWEMDPRFTTDAAGEKTWAPITLEDSGERIEGARQAYRGAGGYAYVCALNELEEACLVELHMILHEPADWFRGSHYLRSKIPIVMQENARRFRRRVMED